MLHFGPLNQWLIEEEEEQNQQWNWLEKGNMQPVCFSTGTLENLHISIVQIPSSTLCGWVRRHTTQAVVVKNGGQKVSFVHGHDIHPPNLILKRWIWSCFVNDWSQSGLRIFGRGELQRVGPCDGGQKVGISWPEGNDSEGGWEGMIGRVYWGLSG